MEIVLFSMCDPRDLAIAVRRWLAVGVVGWFCRLRGTLFLVAVCTSCEDVGAAVQQVLAERRLKFEPLPHRIMCMSFRLPSDFFVAFMYLGGVTLFPEARRPPLRVCLGHS